MYIRGDIYIFIGPRFPLPPGEGVGGLTFFQKIPISKAKQAPSGKSPPGQSTIFPGKICRMVATFFGESQYTGITRHLSFLTGEKNRLGDGHQPRRGRSRTPRRAPAGTAILGSNYNGYLTIIFSPKHKRYLTIIFYPQHRWYLTILRTKEKALHQLQGHIYKSMVIIALRRGFVKFWFNFLTKPNPSARSFSAPALRHRSGHAARTAPQALKGHVH